MRNYFLLLLISFLLIDQHDILAQDTFYVKKKNAPVVSQPLRMAAWDSTNHDSIISYTVEYPSKTGNIWVIAHLKGPGLYVPNEAPRGKRVLFSDIIAIDSTGTRYRKPDRYYVSGIWVPKDPPKKQ